MRDLGTVEDHALTSSTERATYTWSAGLCVVRHHPQQVMDAGAARRTEEERALLCPEHSGTVLHVIPANIDMFDQDALQYWMSPEATEAVLARAVVVPSGITALKHRIRWMFFSSELNFRVFRNEQVAKGWLIDCWLQSYDMVESMDHSSAST